jgi:hypothetical protein
MQVVQAELTQVTTTGIAHMITWLPVDPRLKKGAVVTLKDDAGTWQVADLYARMEAEDIQRGWGLNLPKSQRTER